MHDRGDVPPKTVGVELRAEGVAVEYLDGRETLYRGVPRRVTESVAIPPETSVHVLVTGPDETEGVMLYVNDLKTEDEILESTGVGRVVLGAGESEELFPGVRVACQPDERTVVTADPAVARGRVFVFADDQWTDRRYEFVPPDAVSEQTASDDEQVAASDEQVAASGEQTASDGQAAAADGRTTTDSERAENDGWIEEPAVEEQ